jgi:hypothetical protein
MVPKRSGKRRIGDVLLVCWMEEFGLQVERSWVGDIDGVSVHELACIVLGQCQ